MSFELPEANNVISPLVKLLPILIPVFLLQFGLMIGAIISIARKDEKSLRFENKVIWLLIVIFIGLIGPIIYFILGNSDNNNRNGNDGNGNGGGYYNDYYYRK